MAREPDADSRPISVAEILARTRAAEERDAADPASGVGESGGRRRRGGAGSFSVSELTGEQPRIGGGSAHSGSFAAIDRETAFGTATDGAGDIPDGATLAAESSFVPSADEAHVGDTDRYRSEPSLFPRSEPPRPTGEPFPRSEPPTGRPVEPPVADGPRWAAPHDDRPVHPPTRDFSSGAVADRLDEDSTATGIIPRYADAPLAAAWPDDVVPSDADLDDLSPEERERAFERYRNFEDIPEEPVAAPKKRRGLLGALRALGGDRDTTPPATPPVEATQQIVDEAPRDHPYRVDPGLIEVADDTDTLDPGTETVSLDTAASDIDDDSWVSAAWSSELGAGVDPDHEIDDHDDGNDVVETATAEPARSEPTQAFSSGRRRRDDDPDTEVVDLDQAQLGGYDSSRTDRAPAPVYRAVTRAADDTDRTDLEQADLDRTDTDHDNTAAATDGPSPTRQWVILGLQVLAGLVVGVGLFLGFTELWRWNVYFALVLSVVVIFGLVTFVHVIRRSQDLLSTLLALAVGLIVTIGPLALLASGS